MKNVVSEKTPEPLLRGDRSGKEVVGTPPLHGKEVHSVSVNQGDARGSNYPSPNSVDPAGTPTCADSDNRLHSAADSGRPPDTSVLNRPQNNRVERSITPKGVMSVVDDANANIEPVSSFTGDLSTSPLSGRAELLSPSMKTPTRRGLEKQAMRKSDAWCYPGKVTPNVARISNIGVSESKGDSDFSPALQSVAENSSAVDAADTKLLDWDQRRTENSHHQKIPRDSIYALQRKKNRKSFNGKGRVFPPLGFL